MCLSTFHKRTPQLKPFFMLGMNRARIGQNMFVFFLSCYFGSQYGKYKDGSPPRMSFTTQNSDASKKRSRGETQPQSHPHTVSEDTNNSALGIYPCFALIL